MKIGVIGTGRMGSLLGQWWLKAGHEVLFSLPSRQDSLQKLAEATGVLIKSGTPQEAAQFGEVILLAVPWVETRLVLEELGSLKDKVTLDVSNPFKKSGDSWEWVLPEGTKAGEVVAGYAHNARVIKAYNTVGSEAFRDGTRPAGAEQYCVVMSGDDAAAKELVAELVRDTGFVPLDLGPMSNVHLQEPPNGPFYGTLLTAEQARTRLAALGI